MPSILPKARAMGCLLLLPLLAATGCVSAGSIVAPRTACSALLPPEWRKPVGVYPLDIRNS